MDSWSYNKSIIINTIIRWLRIIERNHGLSCWIGLHHYIKGELPSILHTYDVGKVNYHHYKKCKYCDICKLSKPLPDDVRELSDAEITKRIKNAVAKKTHEDVYAKMPGLENIKVNVPYGVVDWDKELRDSEEINMATYRTKMKAGKYASN